MLFLGHKKGNADFGLMSDSNTLTERTYQLPGISMRETRVQRGKTCSPSSLQRNKTLELRTETKSVTRKVTAFVRHDYFVTFPELQDYMLK